VRLTVEKGTALGVVCAVAGMTSCVGCAASQHTTSVPVLRVLRHARAEKPFLRDFPRAPGTVSCTIRPGETRIIRPGQIHPRGVLYGSCTTGTASQSADGRIHVVFSERLHGSASSPMQYGRFTATLSRTGHVLEIDAAGQTPQIWK